MTHTIAINQIGGSHRIDVRRDLRYLLTPESTAWLLKKNGSDEDTSDEYKELDEC